MKTKHFGADIIIWLAAAVALFPVIFIAANSLMGQDEIISRYSPEILASNAGDFSSHNIHFVRFGLLRGGRLSSSTAGSCWKARAICGCSGTR